MAPGAFSEPADLRCWRRSGTPNGHPDEKVWQSAAGLCMHGTLLLPHQGGLCMLCVTWPLWQACICRSSGMAAPLMSWLPPEGARAPCRRC